MQREQVVAKACTEDLHTIRPEVSGRSRAALIAASLLLLPTLILAGAWRLGGASALEDDLLYYLPIRQYIGQRVAAGELPLWNPLVGMGTSLAADPQSGLWYPATYLFAVLPPLLHGPGFGRGVTGRLTQPAADDGFGTEGTGFSGQNDERRLRHLLRQVRVTDLT